MLPVKFPESNMVYAKDQKQYIPLPVYQTPDGVLTSCWPFTWRERLRVLFGKPLWIQVLTFNQPLQPMKLLLDKPLMPDLSWPRKRK